VITGPGYAASTRAETPKSASLRSMRREVKSSVSLLTISCAAGASSSSASGGSLESGMSVNSGRCRSFTARSDFGAGAGGGTTTTGLALLVVLAQVHHHLLALGRGFLADAAVDRLFAARRTAATTPSIPAPMRSITRSHEMPNRSDSPTSNSAASIKVAPLKPNARAAPCPACRRTRRRARAAATR
jgi:hypothetical protein